MANEVFANGREISCKSGDGKVIASFPDVCLTPPENPATPPGVPVPYPITSFSSDSTEGTKNVKINGKEVMLKNISYYNKCTGDEAGCAAKKGVITSSNISKTYFKSWSTNVKFEGENVLRHLDITTSNHRSDIGNASTPLPNAESQAVAPSDPNCQAPGAAAAAAQNALPPNATEDNAVVAGATFSPAPGSPSLPSISMASNLVGARMIVMGGIYRMFSKGIKKNQTSNVKCSSHPDGYDYPSSGRPKQGHAESRIIEDLFKLEGQKPKGTLRMKVTGRPICCSCQGLIACAQESGLNIVICPPDERDKCP